MGEGIALCRSSVLCPEFRFIGWPIHAILTGTGIRAYFG